MMRFKVIALESFAIFVSYLVFSLSFVSATDVNIMFNGQVQETAQYGQESLVNIKIEQKHEPSDITWTNVKLVVNLNSASLSHSIKRIFLYKCRSQTPTECVRTTPEVFDNYVDTELLWKDISEKTGSAQYPQSGNLLLLVKMEDENGKDSWVGFYTQTRRANYNTFDTSSYSIQSIDVYAKSLDLVQPIKSYIENKLMVPFKWATKVSFTGSTQLYGLGGTSSEMDSHQLQTAVVSSSEISSINKEFYFVSPKISSGIANPILLNLNPTFTCGDGKCEADIGEASGTCCLDCGCETGYCDVIANSSSCKTNTMSLSVVSAATPLISDCTRGFTGNISVRVNNPPSSLTYPVTGTVTLNQTVYSVSCSGVSGSLECSIPISSGIKCGGGSYVIGPGYLNLNLNYKDGKNSATKSLNTSFSGVSVSYDCTCGDDRYCDSVKKTCQSEAAITLGITYLTSYLDDYHLGDRIYLRAKVFNPPAGLVLVDKSATMNLTNGQVSPGTPECSAPNSQFEYNCSIPFQIAGYANTQAYTFSPNTLYFMLTYNDGPLAKTKTISVPFGPVSIPSQSCGDGQCNMGESQAACCLDCGCPASGDFCDSVRGCQPQDTVAITVNSVYPTEFTDCRQSHEAILQVDVNNAPTGMSLDYFTYMQAGLIKGWNMQCYKSTVSTFNCTLVIPPLESEGCSLPYKTVGPNSINMSLSFPNGKQTQITKQLSADFKNLIIVPTYHCGDGVCESSLLENASNCCYDCSCSSDSLYGEGYYCNFDSTSKLGGCMSKSSMKLVIDYPTAPITLQSCELTNSVNIKARIENQPKSMRPEYFYATLNGTPANYVYCTPQQAYAGANYTFNCTLLVPSVYACHQGDTYIYEPNALTVLIGFENGASRTESWTLSSSIPQIRINQGIRTIYDITLEAKAKTKQRIQDLMAIMKDLIDEIKNCYEQVKLIIYATLILSVYVGIQSWADAPSSKDIIAQQKQQGTATTVINAGAFRSKVSTAVQDASLTAAAGSQIAQAWAKFCEMLQTYYQVAIKSLEIEQKLDQMEMCFEIQQHELDIGRCNGQEQSCFSSMVNCVNFGQISSTASQLTSIVASGASSLESMATALSKAAGYVQGIGATSGIGTLQIGCGGLGLSDGGSCCGSNGASGTVTASGTITSCSYKDLQISYVQSTTSCSGSYIVLMDGGKITTSTIRGDNIGFFDDQTHTFTLYCDANKNGQVDPTTENAIASLRAKLLKPNAYNADSKPCECTGGNEGSTSSVTGCCQYVNEFASKGKDCAFLTQASCSDMGSYMTGFVPNTKCESLTNYATVCGGVTTPSSITATPPKAQMDLTVGGEKVTIAAKTFVSGQKFNFVCNALSSTSSDRYMLRLTVKTKLKDATDYDNPLYDNSKEYTPNKDATPQLVYNYNDVNFDCNSGTRIVVGDCSMYKIPYLGTIVTSYTIENADTKQLTCIGTNS